MSDALLAMADWLDTRPTLPSGTGAAPAAFGFTSADLRAEAALIQAQRRALTVIANGAATGTEQFKTRLGARKTPTWRAVKVLQDHLIASGNTARKAADGRWGLSPSRLPQRHILAAPGRSVCGAPLGPGAKTFATLDEAEGRLTDPAARVLPCEACWHAAHNPKPDTVTLSRDALAEFVRLAKMGASYAALKTASTPIEAALAGSTP